MAYILVPSVFLLAWVRLRWYKHAVYRYALTDTLITYKRVSNHPYKKIFFTVRFITLLIMALLIAKPQWVDPESKLLVDGIDIMLVLDVSGSMRFRDSLTDERSRFDVAKLEAMHFVEKRDNDTLGLVIFGKDAVSRCPLTPDKNILKDIIKNLHIGVINPEGTKLSTALVTAANRLKQSTAKSKIIILLTDGEPSEGDMNPRIALEVAKKLDIKIYTIGIGGDGAFFSHPVWGLVKVPDARVNKELLALFARETGGQFFLAKDPDDMHAIYDTIDTLEKVEHETPLFSRYYDYFIPFVWLLCAIISSELLLSAFVWFGL